MVSYINSYFFFDSSKISLFHMNQPNSLPMMFTYIYLFLMMEIISLQLLYLSACRLFLWPRQIEFVCNYFQHFAHDHKKTIKACFKSCLPMFFWHLKCDQIRELGFKCNNLKCMRYLAAMRVFIKQMFTILSFAQCFRFCFILFFKSTQFKLKREKNKSYAFCLETENFPL